MCHRNNSAISGWSGIKELTKRQHPYIEDSDMYYGCGKQELHPNFDLITSTKPV
jgi:hypothetical protein